MDGMNTNKENRSLSETHQHSRYSYYFCEVPQKHSNLSPWLYIRDDFINTICTWHTFLVSTNTFLFHPALFCFSLVFVETKYKWQQISYIARHRRPCVWMKGLVYSNDYRKKVISCKFIVHLAFASVSSWLSRWERERERKKERER